MRLQNHLTGSEKQNHSPGAAQKSMTTRHRHTNFFRKKRGKGWGTLTELSYRINDVSQLAIAL
jgi:hypothetical protein